MTDKKEIMKKHWESKTTQPFNETVINHLNYAFDAMTEYADLQSKEKAIGFAEWFYTNVIVEKRYDHTMRPFSELYEIFTKQK